MIWWRGRGLWMGLLVALCIFSTGQLFGEVGVPIGCAASAAMIFFLKDWLGESSLYSIPARFWSLLLLGLSIVLFIKKLKS